MPCVCVCVCVFFLCVRTPAQLRSYLSSCSSIIIMGLLFVLASYAAFYHVGQLLMCLVVVQPVGDGSVVRWCFASTISLSLSLFSAVLADMARASLFTSAGQPQSSVQSALQYLQRRVEVNAREFTLLLLCLLAMVLVACPAVMTLSFFHHVLLRGSHISRGGHKQGRAARRGSRSRRSSTQSNGSKRHNNNRSSGSSPSRRGSAGCGGSSTTGFTFDEVQKSRRRLRGLCRLRPILFLILVALLLSGGYWASRTGRLDLARPGQRVVGIGKAVYRQLQTRTALFRMPREIQSSRSGEGAADAFVSTPPPSPQDNTRDWSFGLSAASAALTPLDLLGAVRAVTSRVAVVGVAMIGLLAGYAAITSPCLFLAPYTYYRGREEELRKAQHNFTKKLCYVLGNYGNAQRQIAALQYGVLHEEWASPAFYGNASSPNTHNAPPPFDQPMPASGSDDHHNSYYSTAPDSLDPVDASSPAQQQDAAPQSQFVETASTVKHLPPPPPVSPSRQLGPSKPFNAATVSSSDPPAGAVSWLQRKLTSAATAVTNSITGRVADSPASPGSSVMSPAVSRQRAVTRIKKLREESKGSRFLCLSLYLQLNEVEVMLQDAQRGGTWVGRWYAGLAIAMALYSAVKIALTAASLWYFKASTQDPVTRAVTLLEDAFIFRRRHQLSGPSFSVTAVEVSTHVILALALAVNGWMVLSSIRGALLALFHVTMSFSGSAISRPETVAVGLSMLIGVYFVGQLVLLRASLPGSSQWQEKSADNATALGSAYGGTNVLLQVLGTLPYYFYQRLHDSCFLVGCVGAVIVRRFVLRNALSSVVNIASGGEER